MVGIDDLASSCEPLLVALARACASHYELLANLVVLSTLLVGQVPGQVFTRQRGREKKTGETKKKGDTL